MPSDQNQQHPRRPHYHRGRRGPDRRGGDRRPQPAQQNESTNRDQLDVEQIMREIRSRISEKHGIDLSAAQIQELAARRLEAILDPRAIKPSLMDELRRAAGIPADSTPSEPTADATVVESAFYESESGFLKSLRRLLNPLLRLLIDPKAIVEALNGQARKTSALAAQEAERRRRQTEWNALHFEILRRLVTDIVRAEIDNQHLTQRVESLQARVDFNERRVRGLEQTAQQQPRPPRPVDSPALFSASSPPSQAAQARSDDTPSADPAASPDMSPEGGRRRRRRRRGRRSGQARDLTGATSPGLAATGNADQGDPSDQGGDADDFADEGLALDDATDDATLPTPASVTTESLTPESATPELATAELAESAAPAPEPVEPAPQDRFRDEPEQQVASSELDRGATPPDVTPAPEPATQAPEPATTPEEPPDPNPERS